VCLGSVESLNPLWDLHRGERKKGKKNEKTRGGRLHSEEMEYRKGLSTRPTRMRQDGSGSSELCAVTIVKSEESSSSRVRNSF